LVTNKKVTFHDVTVLTLKSLPALGWCCLPAGFRKCK